MQRLSLALCFAAASAFQLPSKLQMPSLNQVAAATTAAAVSVHAEAAHAKSVLGVNGALDFGPLAGDQPGGEGTGKVRDAPTHCSGARRQATCQAPAARAQPAAHLALCCVTAQREKNLCSQVAQGRGGAEGVRPGSPGCVPEVAGRVARWPHARHTYAPSPEMLMRCATYSPPQALGVNDDSLFGVLFVVTFAVFYAFSQWQSYQDDDEDFFDTYESRRVDFENSNRNRV